MAPKAADRAQLAQFHTDDYLESLLENPELEPAPEYGLEGDAAPFRGLDAHVALVAGGTLAAAEELATGRARVAIHWDGGRHHARADAAAGFCYVNDIVLGILRLLSPFKRVLYLDLDMHHGDGVESAFSASKAVLTASVHLHGRGFYPGTGGESRPAGSTHAVNVPFSAGQVDRAGFGDAFVETVGRLVEGLAAAFQPGAIVVQVGADALVGDPLVAAQRAVTPGAAGPCGPGGLGAADLVAALAHVLTLDLPTLVLGGGGYHETSVPRCYALLTALCAGGPALARSIGTRPIPEHEHWPLYAHLGDATLLDDSKTGEFPRWTLDLDAACFDL